jgi:hypothetical protein
MTRVLKTYPFGGGPVTAVVRHQDMNTDIATFCAMIQQRSDENRRAMQCFTVPYGVVSPAFSILRQELDSMIRVIYLLLLPDLNERDRLIGATLRGEKWKVSTINGKLRDVTDREMVDAAQQLQGWTRSVYRFGCAFVHLSDFHNHFTVDPFQRLSQDEREDILHHMRNYHGGPLNDNPDMREIADYVPRVFEKIADNLRHYIEQLARNEVVTL